MLEIKTRLHVGADAAPQLQIKGLFKQLLRSVYLVVTLPSASVAKFTMTLLFP
jgi:hypothetical protein